MKKISILIVSALVSLLLFSSCSSTVDNWIKIQNLASNDVYLNFRANLIHVPSGQTVQLNEIDKGLYDYETIYEIPSGATGSGTEGEAAGQFEIRAGTKILIAYTSTFIENNYILYASVTTSDDLSVDEDPNPIGP
jgi:hypothetical protein